ncbi:MAG: HNH endonuclease signature motif containing protein, partial [Vicinamibacterales bacterium]
MAPGCDRPPGWCDVHHRKHWVDGGPTSIQNLELRCHRTTTTSMKGNGNPNAPADAKRRQGRRDLRFSRRRRCRRRGRASS